MVQRLGGGAGRGVDGLDRPDALAAADRGELDIARLVLVGDRNQLRAVEAGQPFRLLQQPGMTTAVMVDICRQRSPDLQAALQAVLAGDPGEAVELLGGSVHEVAFDELGEKAAQAWLELPPRLGIGPSWSRRRTS